MNEFVSVLHKFDFNNNREIVTRTAACGEKRYFDLLPNKFRKTLILNESIFEIYIGSPAFLLLKHALFASFCSKTGTNHCNSKKVSML